MIVVRYAVSGRKRTVFSFAGKVSPWQVTEKIREIPHGTVWNSHFNRTARFETRKADAPVGRLIATVLNFASLLSQINLTTRDGG